MKFVMLSTLGPDGHARLRNSPERLREVNADVEAMGVKVLEQFALLGQHQTARMPIEQRHADVMF